LYFTEAHATAALRQKKLMKKMSSPTAAALDQLLLVVMTMTMIEVLVATRCCGFHVLDGGGYAGWLLHLVVAVKKCISVKFQ
jgi:hypothetical protein